MSEGRKGREREGRKEGREGERKERLEGSVSVPASLVL